MKSIIKDINFYFVYLEREETEDVGLWYMPPSPTPEAKNLQRIRHKKTKSLSLRKKAEE